MIIYSLYAYIFAGYVYLTLHRRIVREVGRMLECYMEDHDLTKTRVVQIALGYMWHWIDTTRDRMSDEERELQELGKDCIKAGEWDTQCQSLIARFMGPP